MNARPKLPAYGKALLNARRAGQHPISVMVIYGHKWFVDNNATRLAVKPEEAIGLDWLCIADVPVVIEDRMDSDDGNVPEQNSALLRMAGEIAREAAQVTLKTQRLIPCECGHITPGNHRIDIVAFLCRQWSARERRMKWPAWWSEEIELSNEKNRRRWLSACVRHVERRSA